MAKRLTEEDIRRIFREEAERQKVISEMDESTKEVRDRLMARKGGGWMVSCEYDLLLLVDDILNTYWEVVEEDLND